MKCSIKLLVTIVPIIIVGCTNNNPVNSQSASDNKNVVAGSGHAVAIVYEDENFKGYSKYVYEGQNEPNLANSLWNDKISSMRLLDDAIKITFYSDRNFKGNVTTLSTRYSSQYNTSDIANDAISSYKVDRITPSPICARVWADKDYQGAYRDLYFKNEDGTTANSPLPTPISWNDKISSLKTASGGSLIVFENANYSGRSHYIPAKTEIPFLENINFNDQISSWQVVDSIQNR
jgi:hypothetical protein